MNRLCHHVALCLTLVTAGACGILEEEESVCGDAELLPEVCAELGSAAASPGGKADDLPRMRGIIVERRGNRTYFKIPLAYTVGGDQKRLLDETIAVFGAKLGVLNQDMIERGVDLSAIIDTADREEFVDNYVDTLDAVFSTDIEDEMEVRLGATIEEPRKLHTWQRYLVPQAFIAYFGAKFSVNVGIGGGFSATVMLVAQPWLSLGVDHTLAEPRVVEKRYEVDVAVLGVPNVDVGFGVGGGVPIRIGVGTVFGPLDRPEDLAGFGIGLSGSGSLPIIGGGSAKFITVLQNPPLFLGMLGYSSGTSGGWELHGNFQRIMDLDAFLDWASGVIGGAEG